MRAPSRFLSITALATATLAAAAVLAGPAGGAVPTALPSQDPFYSYTGSTPLSQLAPGTVLKHRTVTLAAGTTSTPVSGDQYLYRTTNELNKPVTTVTTVFKPATGTVNPRVVAYLSVYDSLGEKCDPSYTLTGGDPGSANQQYADLEQGLVTQLVAAGFIVTVPDYEGEKLDWVAGQESGMATLDAVKATLSGLALPTTTPVGLEGYSGGSIAGEWASELAASYAPTLNLVGAALGGIPVDIAHNLAYVNGSVTWSGVIPAVLTSLARSFNVNLAPYESAYGRQLSTTVAAQCISEFNGQYPGLTYPQLLKPQYQDIYHVPAFRKIFNTLIMGTAPGHPTIPLLMVAGNHDGIGDDVMILGDQEALAHEYCGQGVSVQYQEIQNADHGNAGAVFDTSLAPAFLTARFAGVPATNNCASIPAGNSLAPIGSPSS